MNKTRIEWCDYTWNPIVGCSPTSPGCDHCYAAAIARRFGLPWGAAHFLPERLGQPAAIRKPGRVFVGSMTDLGHETVQPEWRREIAEAMRVAYWHTYIVLTKRPGIWLEGMPKACWVGVTVESRAQIFRWRTMLDCCWPQVPVRFVSVEPMLGPVSFAWLPFDQHPDWVIAGPETGPGARPCDHFAFEELAAESPCFFDKRKGATRREFPR